MDPRSPDLRQSRHLDLVEMYATAIAELRSLHDPGVTGLIDRLERHRRLIASSGVRFLARI
jgi:hypothetical protein